ncbi:unnamed protein product [Soboliphyme baturini]|uniref:IBD domain-containing protein n=1 Tax=Soboliphyme baturini TaxID=241478 RepID=A0A183IYZ6_9BILA|nr:unnamed protein product [Soboliphyme baturini]
MRGGRNKFGSMYKRDRARRMQAYQRLGMPSYYPSGSVSATSSEQLVSSTSPPNDPGLPFTDSTNAEAILPCDSKLSPMKPYTSNIQSPTLTSSTRSPPNGLLTVSDYLNLSSYNNTLPNSLVHSSNYIPNCDNLAALLSASMDENLRSWSNQQTHSFSSSQFSDPLRLLKSELKPELYDPDSANFGFTVSGSDFYPNYTHFNDSGLSGSLLTGNAAPFARIREYSNSFPASAVTTMSNENCSLPLCPIPTSKSFQMNLNYYGNITSLSNQSAYSVHPPLNVVKPDPVFANGPSELLVKLARSLTNDAEWQNDFIEHAKKLRVEPFAVICHAIDHSLFRQVDWAKNCPYFKELSVS